MNLIIKPRRHDKTTELIKIANERDGYIVCRDHFEARRISKDAQKMDMNILFPLTYQELMCGRYHGVNIREFYIDDADILLQQLTDVPIRTITMTDNAETGYTHGYDNGYDDGYETGYNNREYVKKWCTKAHTETR